MKFFNVLIFFILFSNFEIVDSESIAVEKAYPIDSLLVRAGNPQIQKSLRLDYADKALEILKSADNPKFFTNNCVQIANVFYLLEKKEKYLKTIDFLLEKSIQNNNSEGIAWASYLKGNYYYSETDYDSSYYYYSKSEKVSISLEYRFLLGNILNAKSSILNIKKDYVNAEINAIKALRIGLSEKIMW